MRKQRKLSPTAARVLGIFLDAPDREIYGLQIIQEAAVPSGSLYPIAHLLERLGVIEGTWEDLETAAAAGHRPRKKYRLKPDGVEHARDLVAEAEVPKARQPEALKPRTA
ncbi:MAG TPA: helix-turn-helix transcriptional regulator [Solirubrobacterales bacterium]|nr:helix-turn-helix transcriptional regulator [Solirubrobacterales bacterium]